MWPSTGLSLCGFPRVVTSLLLSASGPTQKWHHTALVFLCLASFALIRSPRFIHIAMVLSCLCLTLAILQSTYHPNTCLSKVQVWHDADSWPFSAALQVSGVGQRTPWSLPAPHSTAVRVLYCPHDYCLVTPPAELRHTLFYRWPGRFIRCSLPCPISKMVP